MKIILVFTVFLSVALITYANCYTGFACSVSDLELSQINEFNSNLNNYFDKNINDTMFFTKKRSQLTYNDLFIFNTIL